MKIKRLKKEFTGTGEVKNFRFTQIAYSNCAYLYLITAADGTIHFEVFGLKFRKPHPKYGDLSFDFIEKYPKGEDFGKWAWTYKDLESAYQKFNEIQN